MEQIPSRESSQQHIDALLMRAQTHALPVDVVENITKEIEALKVSSDDSAIEKILQLQKTLEESTITVQTLSDFKLLLERVALNNIHFDAVMEQVMQHKTGVEKIRVSHEGYSLLVCKDGESYRYKAWASYSHPMVQERVSTDQTTLRLSEDTKKIESLRKEIEEGLK